jgi:dihydrolipoamide dehydrogenase
MVPAKALLHTVRTAENLMKQKDRGIKLDGCAGIDLAAAVERSKKIIETLRKGIAFLLKRNKVETVFGRGRLAAPGRIEVEGKCIIECGSVILATGGRPRELPFAPFDGENILSTTDALGLTSPPPEAAVIGAGASGMEIGLVWAACGSKVTVIEILDRILPFLDEEAVKIVAKSCRKRGIDLMAGTRVTSLEKSGGKVKLAWQGPAGAGELSVDRVLVAAGTSANLEGLWEPGLPIQVEGGFVETDEVMRTTLESVYAIGDLSGPPLLAHAASHEGIVAVEHIAGAGAGRSRAAAVPSVVHFAPQVAQVGITDKEALEKNLDAAVGRFPFAATSMAVAQDETEGFVKIVSEKQGGKILGATIVGSEAGELIGEVSTALAAGMTVKEFLAAVHPHPTLSEALHEAALDALGAPIHKV